LGALDAPLFFGPGLPLSLGGLDAELRLGIAQLSHRAVDLATPKAVPSLPPCIVPGDMEDRQSHEELLAYAAERCRCGSHEVGAAYDRDLTERGRDEARRWRFLVVDAAGRWAYVDFLATRVSYSASLTIELLEHAVEHFVGCRYPSEARLAGLRIESAESEGPIALPLDDRYRREPAASL
jgi:hypothetical protein